MAENMARLERAMRMLVSVLLLIYGYLSENHFLLVIGLLVLATSLLGWCPISWVAQRIMLKFRN